MPKYYIQLDNSDFVVSADDIDQAILKLWNRRFNQITDGGLLELALDVRMSYSVSETGCEFSEHGSERAYSMAAAELHGMIDDALIHVHGYDAWDQFVESMLERYHPL